MPGRSPSPYRRRSPVMRDRRYPRRRRRSYSKERFEMESIRRTPTQFQYKRHKDDDYYERYQRSPYYHSHDRDRYEDRDTRDSYDRNTDASRDSESPQTFKDFMYHLPYDVTPAEAERQYRDYLTDWWGSQIKAEFEQIKNEEWLHMKYDPRLLLKQIEIRKEHAKEALEKFIKDIESGELDPELPDFNQGVENDTYEKINKAPPMCWNKDRIYSDLKLSKELIKVLDKEKEIDTIPKFMKEIEELEEKDDKKDEIIAEDHGHEHVNEHDQDGIEHGIEHSEHRHDYGQEKQKQEEENNDNNDNNDDDDDEFKEYNIEFKESKEFKEIENLVADLDLQLIYLWRIHMVDYYSGHELEDHEYKSATSRMIRPKKTKEDDEEKEKEMLEELRVRVDYFWEERMKNGDPISNKAQKERIEKEVDAFIEDQVIFIEEKKWGNKLSNKMFVGKEFVLKHIRLKHSATVEEEREKIMDRIFYENFKKEKEEQQKKEDEEKKKKEEELNEHQALDNIDDYGNGFVAGQGAPAAILSNTSVIGAPIVPPAMIGGAMGQVLMPAPGAGPLGPFIIQPVPPRGRMSPNSLTTGSYENGRSSHMRPRGPMRNGVGVNVGRGTINPLWNDNYKEYYDLDAPKNNRAALDYGDL